MNRESIWDTDGLKRVLAELSTGITIAQYFVIIIDKSPGRFVEEDNLKIALADESDTEFLLAMKVFWGRVPYYRPWVEVFSIIPEIKLRDRVFKYFGSEVEKWLMVSLGNALPPGSSIFVEYVNDEITSQEISGGVYPPFTRLGYVILKSGFTWFKDWYYSEGLREGNIKLQAQKPLAQEDFKRQINEIRRVAESLLKKNPNIPPWNSAVQRAKEWLSGLGVSNSWTSLTL